MIGAIGAAVTAAIVTQAEMVLATLHIGLLQLPPVSMALLLFVVAVNQLLRRIAKRWQLTPADMLVIYCMSLIAAMVSSHGIVQKFIPLLVTPKYMENGMNGFHQLFDPHIQARLVPYDPANGAAQPVVDNYYSGLPHGGSIPWKAWVSPLLNWGFLICLVVFAFLCVAAILRRQWMDNERLAFPLTQLPLEIANDEQASAFFRNRLTWVGVSIPLLVYSVKTAHMLAPSIPGIPIQWDWANFGLGTPWNAAACTYFVVSFAAIGFFYLLPTDILFSMWFFFLLTRVEMIVGAQFNYAMPWMPLYPLPAFIGYQTIGAYLVLTCFLFKLAAPHLRTVWRAAIGQERVDDSGEVLPYRVAVWGLIGSIVASALWLWGMGMSFWLALFEMATLLFVTAIVMARATAEAGMLMTETTFRPIDLYRMVAPIHGLGPTNLTLLSFVDHLFLRDQRGLLLTGMLDSSRIAEGARVRQRSFVGVLVLGIAVSLIVAVALNIYLPYHMGAINMDPLLEIAHPSWAFTYYSAYFHGGLVEPDSAQMAPNFLTGIGVTVLLSYMRTMFYWWPLHPLGYALSGSWGVVMFWFPCFLAWICKSLTMRYGGMRWYTKLRPLFLGLVIGEFGAAVLLALANIFFRFTPPAFPWL